MIFLRPRNPTNEIMTYVHSSNKSSVMERERERESCTLLIIFKNIRIQPYDFVTKGG